MSSSALLSTITRQSAVLYLDIDEASWKADNGGLLFHVIEVWRSRVGEWGPYEEVTAAGYTNPTIPAPDGHLPDGSTGPSIALHDLILELDLDGAHIYPTTFSGADPFTYATAATAINAQSNGRYSAYVAQGQLRLTSVSAGSGASLRVVESDAAIALGLPTTSPENISFGRDPYIPLITGKQRYTFLDRNSEAGFFYKTRLRNVLDASLGAFSTPFQPKAPSGLLPEQRVLGYCKLASATGGPDVARRLAIRVESTGTLLHDHVVAGGDIELVTNSDGYAETLLVAGSRIQVALGGTDLVRSITVPSVQFNLFDPAYGTDDVFRVQSSPEHHAVRRSRLPLAVLGPGGRHRDTPP